MKQLTIRQEIVTKLKQTKKFFVTSTSNEITLTKNICNKLVTIVLQKTKDGKYIIKPFKYSFRSSISHFDYKEDETRWIRNKAFFMDILRLFKNLDVIKYITNSTSFLKVNSDAYSLSTAKYKKLNKHYNNLLRK